MRSVVVGAGAVGGYLASVMTRSGLDTALLVRPAQVEVLRRDGLKVSSRDGDTIVQVRCTDRAIDLGPTELVVLAVKTFDVADALAAISPLVSVRTLVLTLQNGVDSPAQVAHALGARHTLAGICRVVCEVEAPGQVRHVGYPLHIAVGALPGGPGERAPEVAAHFRAAGLQTVAPPDIVPALWEKFTFATAWGGLGGCLDLPIGELRADPPTRLRAIQAMLETAAVGRAAGATLSADVVDRVAALADAMPADGVPSLQRDLRAGRRSELEAWTGAVVRLGAQHGVPTATHDRIYELLRTREATNAARRASP